MMLEFGPFQLDEPGRVLRLADREIPLQPRVFDLLVYLVRSRTRVVPKDELLDALWPGITVTEGSLQRAVSMLRGALREGGMESAVRSFPRIGYRFCVAAEPPETETSEAQTHIIPQSVAAAQQAIAEQRWGDAAKIYANASAIESLNG